MKQRKLMSKVLVLALAFVMVFAMSSAAETTRITV